MVKRKTKNSVVIGNHFSCLSKILALAWLVIPWLCFSVTLGSQAERGLEQKKEFLHLVVWFCGRDIFLSFQYSWSSLDNGMDEWSIWWDVIIEVRLLMVEPPFQLFIWLNMIMKMNFISFLLMYLSPKLDGVFRHVGSKNIKIL